ncbi:MAG: extracellular solute-binding protein [Eubacteriales bacterium]|nr:extracellular solute-binding protein [Eubacteriales bacterium]
MKTTLKRIACALLALCVLCSAALAEKRTLCIAQGDVPAGFRSAHPEVSIKLLSYSSRITEMDLLMKDGLDAAALYSGSLDMDALKSAGVLYDLSESAVIREAVSRMHPDIQKYVTDDAGRIVALPYSLYDPSFYWLQSAWDAAGLTEEDVPQSYTQLLDFLEKWMARTAEHPEKKICVSRLTYYTVTGVREYEFTNWLMDMLRYCWEYQQRFAGQPVHYDNPQFYELAERTREIGAALVHSEPSHKKRQKMLELFTFESPSANDGRAYGVSHAIPLRLTGDQPALMNFGGYMWVIRADAPHPEDALALLEAVCLESANNSCAYALYADYPAGSHKVNNQQEPLVVSQGWLDDWRGFEGALVSYPYDYTWEYKPMHQFFDGNLSAEELAQKLNKFIELPWWEQ